MEDRPRRLFFKDMSPELRVECEKVYARIERSFPRAADFRRMNPNARLGGTDGAWVYVHGVEMIVPIVGVQHFDAVLAAAMEGNDSSFYFDDGAWILVAGIEYFASNRGTTVIRAALAPKP